MKRLFKLISFMLTLCVVSCSYDDTSIISRLEQLEKTDKIASIQQQIDAINATLIELKSLDTELKGYFAESVKELEGYVEEELKNNKDWCSATFATLEQYNAIASKVTLLEAEVDNKISVAIDDLESSMKVWVNEQLTGYYTIAEVDAVLGLLKKSVTEGDEALLDEINKLSERIDTMKTTITEAYQSAITAAITENNGVIDNKIADEIAKVNNRIDSEVDAINSRIDTLEGRIEAMEDIINKIQALDIEFDNIDDLVCYQGASTEVSYTIIGGDDATTIECLGDGGWSASIIKESTTTGKIKVTAPMDAASGKVVVWATSGVGGSVVKSLCFDKGILTGILDTYEFGLEACTLEVTLNTNLDYTVNIPVDWITIADTRAEVRTDTLKFSIAESYTGRSAIIELIGECGDVLKSFEIVQGLFAYNNFTITHSGFTMYVTPVYNNKYQWNYYIWEKSSYDSVSTKDIVYYSLNAIGNTYNHPGAETGAATICNYERLNNDSEYVLVIFYLDEYGDKYDNKYTAIPFKTLAPTPGYKAKLEVSEPTIVTSGSKYDIQFTVKTDKSAVDILVGAQLWNTYEFAKYWDPNDWSQIQAFFWFRKPVESTTLADAKTAEGATVSFPGLEKDDYVFFFEVINDENTPTQYAVRVEPSAFEAME